MNELLLKTKILRELADIALEMGHKTRSEEITIEFSKGAEFVYKRISDLLDDNNK